MTYHSSCSYSYLEALITVQVCHEHKKIDHGVLNFGLGYNGTILDGSVVTFRCYTGENQNLTNPNIQHSYLGYELEGPAKKVCDEEQGYLLRGGWVPKEKVICVKSKCSQCYTTVSVHFCVLLALWFKSVCY